MQFQPFSEEDAKLLVMAIAASDRLYLKGVQEVGAAVLTTSREVFSAIHFETSSGYANICGEVAAICVMVAAGHRDLVAVAAVWRSPEGKHFLLPPCGRCRDVISDFNPAARIIITSHPNHWDEDAILHPVVVRVGDLLPLKPNNLRVE